MLKHEISESISEDWDTRDLESPLWLLSNEGKTDVIDCKITTMLLSSSGLKDINGVFDCQLRASVVGRSPRKGSPDKRIL